MGRGEEAVRRSVVAPVLQQLEQGGAPEKLALSLALGVVVPVIPIPGITTLVDRLPISRTEPAPEKPRTA